MHTKTIKGRPYFYTTQREGSKTKTIYLGSERAEALERERALKGNSSHKLFLLFVVFLLLAVSGLTLFFLKGTLLGPTGFTVTDIGGTGENIPIDLLENISDANLSQNISDVQIPIDDTALILPPETNEPSDIVVEEPVENLTTEPVPDVVLPFQDEIPEENISEEIPSLPEMNDTEDVLQNLTDEIVPLNESVRLVNETLNSSLVSEEIIQAQAIIGVPVQWTKHVILDGEASSLEVSLPRDVENVSVREVVDDIVHDIDEAHIRINESGIVSDFSSTDYAPDDGASGGLLTGFVVSSSPRISLERTWHSLSRFFSHIISITGFAVAEEPSDVTLIIDEPVQEVFVDYYTAAPEALEEETGAGKHIDVTSPVAYTNVVAFTDVPNVPADAIQLYAVVNGTYVAQTFSASDTDGDTLIDSITWVIPEIAAGETESYDVALNILTVQSYPLVGGNWTVTFNTTGTADLHIRAVSGTEFGRDIDFLEVRCGDAVLATSLTDGELFISNYSCADTGVEVSHVLKAGVHTLEFTYGDFVAYAYNDATNAPTQGAAIINSSSGGNTTYDNITIFNVSTADADNDPVKNIYNWMLNDALFNYVNIPMEGGSNSTWTRNYANFSTYGRVINGNWTNTSGYDKKGAYHFNGSTDVIEIYKSEPLGDDLKNFSVEYRFMRNESGTQVNSMVAAVAKGGGFPNGFAAGILENNGTIVWMMRSTPYATTWVVQNGTWYHVVFVVETNNVTIYINGVPNISRTVQASGMGFNNVNITIGALQTGAAAFAGFFNGTVDDVRIWNMSLTAQQVDLLYRNQSNVIHSSLTTIGDNFTGQIYPNDLFVDGAGVNASLFISANAAPVITKFFMNSTDPQNRTNATINVSFGLFDPEGNASYFQVDWWLNDVLNTTFANQTNISVGNTTKNDNFTAIVTAYDGKNWSTNFTGTVIITNTPPTIGSLIINTTLGTNGTNQNISVFNISSFDEDNDTTKNIYQWYLSNVPFEVLNMPFESNNSYADLYTRDYSSNNNSGFVSGPFWNATGGYDGRGAYNFSSADGTINITDSDSLDFTSEATFSLWFMSNISSAQSLHSILYKGNTTAENYLIGYQTSAKLVARNGSNVQIYDCAGSTGFSFERRWQHLVYRFNGSRVYYYINGTQVCSTPFVFGPTGTDPLVIGGQSKLNGSNSMGPTDGYIDSLRIYNVSLSDDQIKLLYLNQTNVIHSSLTDPGDNWTAQVYPTDNQSTGTALNASLYVNTVPTITNFFMNTTDPQNRTNGTINVSFGTSDADGNTIRYQIDWYLNNALNMTFANQTNISAGNTTKGDNFTAIVAVYDGAEWATNSTGTVIITNTQPVVGSLVINTTFGTNLTSENISVFNLSVSDGDNDSLKSIYNWYRNTEPFFILNTPFEGGSNNTSTKDYSGRSVNVIVNGSFWNSSGGYDRHGAYTFDGVNDQLELPNNTLFTTSLQTEFTIMAWIYNNGDGNVETIYGGTNELNNETILVQMNAANANIPVTISNGTARQQQANASARAYLRGWAHVAVTYKQGSYIRIYINGTKKVEVAPTLTIIPKQQPFRIGAQYGSVQSAGNWNGTIDDFVLLNTSLSDQQILLYYQNQTNILHSTATVKENWTAQVFVADNDTDSGGFNATLTLLNTLPTIDNFFINTSDPQNRSNGTINVSFGLTDLDNDSLMYQIDWFLNNALNRTFANQTNISAGNTSRADNFTTIVAVFDGTSWGTNQTGFVIINNTPPTPAAIISPNSTDIWNATRLINWTLSVDDANDDWYYNLTLTNTDNTTNTTIATNLGKTISNYSWNASTVKDGQFRINITTTENNTNEIYSVTNVSDLFNISTMETVSPVVTTTEGGGGSGAGGAGGGGGEGKKKITPVEEEFMVDVHPKELTFELAQGEEDEKTFTIRNVGDVARTISLHVVGVDRLATLSDTELTLQPGEQKKVTVYAISSNATGIFTGNINVQVDGGVLEIPLIIEVQSKTVLFDARVDLDPEFVALSPGEKLPVEVTLFSIGAPRKVDVKLQYSVRDIYGNVLWTSSETMAVDQQVTFSKNFQVPGNLPDGTYVFGLEVLYLNSVATSSVTFDALHTLEMPFFKQNFALFLTLLVVAFVAAAGVYIIFTIKGGKPRRRK